MMEKDFFVYILQCSDGSLYTGYTDNVTRRLAKHNAGKGAKYTRARMPVLLAYAEKCDGKSAAMIREASIKKMQRHEKLQLCAAFAENKMGLNDDNQA